jgi:hypothetical protein
MLILTDEQTAALLQQEKSVPSGLRPLSRLVEKNRCNRRDYDVPRPLASGDRFVILVRQNMLNRFDFSAILGYRLPGVNTIFRLRRYNGKSHYHSNPIENERFRDFHIHMATERYQKLGAKEDHFAIMDRRYSDLDGAIDCLLFDCGFRSPMADSPIFTQKIQ